MSNKSPWQRQVFHLYRNSLFAWAFGLGLLVIHSAVIFLSIKGPSPFDQNLIPMLLAAPGLNYFYRTSKKLVHQSDSEAKVTFQKIMKWQNPLGIVALVGAIAGLLPFLVNFFGVLALSANDIWFNLGLMVPWISLYGFVATYLIARSIAKKVFTKN